MKMISKLIHPLSILTRNRTNAVISIAPFYRKFSSVSEDTSKNNDKKKDSTKKAHAKNYSIIGIAGALSGVAFAYWLHRSDVNNEALHVEEDKDYKIWHKTERKDLPTFHLDEIQKHNKINDGVWVTYGIGVYDITSFVSKHPGGTNYILMGAGNAVDPFWHIYQQHNTEEILKLLETFRIGNIAKEDEFGTSDLDSPWINEPKRSPILIPASDRPFNGEPPALLLIKNFLTPNELFYVRNHLPVPMLDEKTYELEVEIEGKKKNKTFNMNDIKKFPKYEVTATIMCGGNRRSDMNAIKKVKGLNWKSAAVGNAKWSGARLSDVLKKLGVKSNETQHVIFEAYDFDPTSNTYAVSIPLSKAMDERGDVLLAYEMNDEPLSRDHGYPLRVIVPGVVGARSAKWIAKIIVSDKESDSHWQQNDYKGFSPSTDWDTVDFSKSPAIQNMPVTSAICLPTQGDKVKVEDGFITVKGYAWSGGGNKIVRVDLTTNEGKDWHVANLDIQDQNASPGRHYAWTLWSAKLPIDPALKEIEIWSKAVDSNYNCQPESFQNTWNLRGVLSHAYHKVKISLE